MRDGVGDSTHHARRADTSYPGAVGRSKVRSGRDQPSNEDNPVAHFKGLCLSPSSLSLSRSLVLSVFLSASPSLRPPICVLCRLLCARCVNEHARATCVRVLYADILPPTSRTRLPLPREIWILVEEYRGCIAIVHRTNGNGRAAVIIPVT